MRHLGRVRKKVLELLGSKHKLGQLLLAEMIFRVLKNSLRMRMRQKMHELYFCRDEPFKSLVVNFLNLMSMSSNFKAI